jgi:hypothetical protein
MTKITIKVLESNKEIAISIGNALLPQVRKYMQSSVSKMKKGLPDIVNVAIINSPEYASILGGRLRYELGIPDPETKLSGLLQVWSNNISVTYTPPVVLSNGGVRSSITIGMIKTDFSDVLGTDYALVYDNERGYALPWLKWLLLDGSVPIVRSHQVVIGPSSKSRTGMAVMRENANSAWGVPKKFAGTQRDNWITRAIDASRDQIYNFIEKAMEI